MSNQDSIQEDEIITETAENHRLAAFHFQLAAKHHLAAAEADEENDVALGGYHAYAAHGHQLRAVGHAEIAAELGVIEDAECEAEECDCD